jgi:hypothetical protein
MLQRLYHLLFKTIPFLVQQNVGLVLSNGTIHNMYKTSIVCTYVLPPKYGTVPYYYVGPPRARAVASFIHLFILMEVNMVLCPFLLLYSSYLIKRTSRPNGK